MADNPTCATCRWFLAPDGDFGGSCHRHAPRLRVNDYPASSFAPVKASDFCGEHAPRVEERRCRMHPDRITDVALFCGHPLCGDCWTEEIMAEQDGLLLEFKKKILKGPESTDAR